MTVDIQSRIGQLVEVNRALAQDLDLSRRLVAELGSEREDLRSHVELLESGFRARESAKRRAHRPIDGNDPEGEFHVMRRELQEIRRERDKALWYAEDAGVRVSMLERQLQSLADEVQLVKEERDDLQLQLDEMNGAMEEIRLRLSALPAEPTSYMDGVDCRVS